MRCPFGCREVHHRPQSDHWTKAYYPDEAGRDKKRAHNAKRRKNPARPIPPAPAPERSLLWPASILQYLEW